MKTVLATMVAAAMLALAASANAATFSFFFTNENGGIPGNVLGTIELPDGDGVFAATSVVIDVFPAALNLGAGPISAAAGGSFTVSGGAITDVSYFEAFLPETALLFNFEGRTGLDLLGCACLASDGVKDVDSSSLRFTAVPVSAVPVPAALPLMAAGVGIFGLMGWRRRKTA